MIKLSKYLLGMKPKDKTEMILADNALVKSVEDLYVLFIPKSIVEELKKGDIGEWE